MAQAIERVIPEVETRGTASGMIVRTSFITQIGHATQVDTAVLDTLYVLAYTVADFGALPDLRVISAGEKSAMLLITAVWPEKITVKMTALATSVPHSDDTSLLIVSAKITSETAPVARGLAGALLDTFPSTIVSRITAITPPLVPLPMFADERVGAEYLEQPRSFNPGDGHRAQRPTSHTGWSIIR
jgi:hypothetical protein